MEMETKRRLISYTASSDRILDAFAKLRKATISFVMSVCPYAKPLLPLDEIS